MSGWQDVTFFFFPVKDWALSECHKSRLNSVCVCVCIYIYACVCVCVCECVLKELAFSDLVREKQTGMNFLLF